MTLNTTKDGRLSFFGAVDPKEIRAEVQGAKAATLMQLADAGLPVPPAFVLGTELCADYYAAGGALDPEIEELVVRGVRQLEQATGRVFGGERNPLLVAVRSGAAVSMPGMLETILDVGLCEKALQGLLRSTGDPAFAWDSYRRLIQSYAEVVDHIPAEPFARAVAEAVAANGVPSASELDVQALQELVGQLQRLYESLSGHLFPEDPYQQLLQAIEAVLRSWNADRAVEYRRIEGLEALMGTAVTIQAMVFGNLGVVSGSGVGFTRDPATGENSLYVDFMLNAQGEDVVAGRHAVLGSEQIVTAVPGLERELEVVRHTLEATFHDAQDFEFTVENGKLWLLQSRVAKRSPLAALQIACDLVEEGLIDPATALQRLSGYDLDQIRSLRLGAHLGIEPIGHATPASGGVASGEIALDVQSALRRDNEGEPVILVRDHASTQDVAGLEVCKGLLTASGTRTSHAAVVARQLGVVCLVNCPCLRIDLERRRLHIGDHELHEFDPLTIDATSGAIYPGTLQRIEEPPRELIDLVDTWRQ